MRRIGSFVKNAAITLGVVSVLVMAAALGYTWYMSQQPPVSAVELEQPPIIQPKQLQPTPPKPGTNVGVSVQSFVESAVKGDTVALTIKTTPTAECGTVVRYGEDKAADRPLETQAADEFGMATWQWEVPGNVPKGKWPVTVTCAFGGKSGVVKPDLVVK